MYIENKLIGHLIMNVKLLGRFAPIFYFNCEHVYTFKNKNKQKFADFVKKFRAFLKKFKNPILIIQKPALESCEVPDKI